MPNPKLVTLYHNAIKVNDITALENLLSTQPLSIKELMSLCQRMLRAKELSKEIFLCLINYLKTLKNIDLHSLLNNLWGWVYKAKNIDLLILLVTEFATFKTEYSAKIEILLRLMLSEKNFSTTPVLFDNLNFSLLNYNTILSFLEIVVEGNLWQLAKQILTNNNCIHIIFSSVDTTDSVKWNRQKCFSALIKIMPQQ